ncbi:MAG: alpha/beta hydrolase [Candidatus Hydrogenedentes bacterium]|nr:alpha/beta hydrolase [Candidatus Hydrogenedentota bacterium]
MMRTIGKICGAMLILALLGALWWLFIDSAPPPRRPDLVRVPAELGPPPKGFPTENALLAAFGLSSIGLMDLDLVDMDASAPEVEGIAVRKDIVYGMGGDTELQLDLYTPEGLIEPAPGLIFIHGGGWRSGKRQDYALYTSRFARHGYVVATVSYRLREAGYFPNSVEDVKAAVRWMRANAAEINVDPDRIAAIGGSAGGHLAMMLGYTSDVPELEGSGGNPGVSSAVQAVVNIYGPVDFSVYPERDHRLVTTYLQGRYEERTEIYELASPILHVDPSDPPTLIIHGTLDTLVPVTQSDLLAEKFQELGMAYWYDRIDGWPHAMDVANPVNARVEQVAVAFLREVFETAAPER